MANRRRMLFDKNKKIELGREKNLQKRKKEILPSNSSKKKIESILDTQEKTTDFHAFSVLEEESAEKKEIKRTKKEERKILERSEKKLISCENEY